MAGSTLLLDGVPFGDLVRLREEADRLSAARPEEAARKEIILNAHAAIKAGGAFAALVELERAYGDRRMGDVDVALAVGARYGRTMRVADQLDDHEHDLLRQVSMAGLDLSREQRLRVLVEALRIEVRTGT